MDTRMPSTRSACSTGFDAATAVIAMDPFVEGILAFGRPDPLMQPRRLSPWTQGHLQSQSRPLPPFDAATAVIAMDPAAE
jgi:hypothetical protein